MALTIHPPSSAKVQEKEYNYTPTPSLGLHGLLQDELYLKIYCVGNSETNISKTKIISWMVCTTRHYNTLLFSQYINSPSKATLYFKPYKDKLKTALFKDSVRTVL
jgi:hypothetical protein